MSDDLIHSFWNEVNSFSKEIILMPDDDVLIKKVDAAVRSLGDYDWEYGPADEHLYYFALSPNFKVELLPEIDYIVYLAPAIDGWEIVSCKPQKSELLEEFEIQNEGDAPSLIDTKGWECIIYKYPDQTIELDIRINNIEASDDIKYLAVDIHLSNLLGERKYIEKIKSVSIVNEFPEDIKARCVPVRDIDSYI